MVKSVRKIFIVMLATILAFGMVCLNCSYASEATISVSAAKINQNFTVTVNIPADAVAYQGKIEVTFSNGTTLSSGKLTKITGLDGALAHPGNMAYTFTAPSAGTATVKVLDLIISGSDSSQLNSQTALEQAINVEAEAVAPAPSAPAPAAPASDSTYTPTNELVYAVEKLNVRKEASSSSTKLGALAKNEAATRVGVGSNGWSQIQYAGQIAYVSSQYLTTKNPKGDTPSADNTTNTTEDNKVVEPNWTSTGDTVYSKKSLNVREGWGTSFKSIGSLSVGQKTTRIAVGDNGWDKIKYEGKEAYVMSKYLTTSKAEVDKLLEEMENETVNNTVNENVVSANTVSNTTVENTVTDEEIYNTIVDEIGVIPQVGKSVVDYIYTFGVMLAIILVSVVGLRVRSKDEE